ncbi:flippase [Halopiger xanaduensis]|uniref:Polysaccharide biosynthesis protein n=1 Tax=Halopiger xanaduensis (strain DSM 18323 / JCM 14033 / SH-6) TaxID=797210 RepID=F8DD50_HALXS|nr:flippase [Halopiger xanaduensis]AEH38937.1 polysaccharide biosynthesis protein [Halopiger xanaduensis SH-6]
MKSGLPTDIISNLVVEILIRLRGLIFIPLITATLGLAAFGVYSQILAITRLLQLIFGLGLHYSLIRFAKSNEDDLAEIYYSILVISIISGVVVYGLLYLFATTISSLTLGTVEYAAVIQIGGFLVVTRILLKLQEDFYRSRSHLKRYSIIRGVEAYGIIGIVLLVLFVFEGTLEELFLGIVGVEVLISGILQVLIANDIGWSVPRFEKTVDHLRYAIPFAFSHLASTISGRIDRILVGSFLGPAAVGVYSAAYQLAVSITIYTFPIRTVYFPEISELFENDRRDEIKLLLDTGSRYFLLIAVPSIAGLYTLTPDLVAILLETSAEVPSNYLVATIAVGIALRGLDRIIATTLNAAKKNVLAAKIRYLGAGLNTVMNILLIPILGVFGAAITTSLTYGLTFCLVFVFVRRIIPVKFPLLTILRTTFAALLMVAVLETGIVHSIPAKIITGVASYTAVTVAVGELTKDDVDKLYNEIVATS